MTLSRATALGQFLRDGRLVHRYQTLTDAWSVKIAATGQVASGPQFTSQQFYLGGAAFGRSYGSAEISGDNGIAGPLELRLDQRLNLSLLTGYQLFSFVDADAARSHGFSYMTALH
jgi:hemolysin activation/secretion protein